MEVLAMEQLSQVSGGARTLQAIGDFMGIAAGASLLLGPGGVPLAITFGIGAAAFEITDSFLD